MAVKLFIHTGIQEYAILVGGKFRQPKGSAYILEY